VFVSQNQCGQSRIPSFGIVIYVHAELVLGFTETFGNYGKVKRSLVEKSAVHVIFLLEHALWQG
jgi:hypothetical protein